MALTLSDGNVEAAAATVGISRQALYARLRRRPALEAWRRALIREIEEVDIFDWHLEQMRRQTDALWFEIAQKCRLTS